jgi:citrate lyase gamma subunit
MADTTTLIGESMMTEVAAVEKNTIDIEIMSVIAITVNKGVVIDRRTTILEIGVTMMVIGVQNEGGIDDTMACRTGCSVNTVSIGVRFLRVGL